MSESQNSGEVSPEKAEVPVDGIGTISLLISGMVVWGGAGWLLDRLTDHQALFLPIGILFGLGLAIYMLFARLHVLGHTHSSRVQSKADADQGDGEASAERRSGSAQNRPDSLDSRRKGSP